VVQNIHFGAKSMYQHIRSQLDKGQPVLLDGPMGTELVRRGVRWRKHGLVTDAAQVQQLHEEYLSAGADVLRTNTFQLNPHTYLDVFRNLDHMRHIGAPGLEQLPRKLLGISVQLAREARDRSGARIPIAGVLSPLEHCFRPDLAPPTDQARREHDQLARFFAEDGVDFLLLESMNTIGEAKAALAAGRAVGLPVWVSFVLGPEGELLSREPLSRAVTEMEEGGAEAVLVNCAPPEDISLALDKLRSSTKLPFGAFAHIGRFSPPSWKFEFFPQFIDTEEWSPERYAAQARRWCEQGATIVGGCCGTSPAHIRALRERVGIKEVGAA
jgi:S-methylmethionine-dependent homocysteine/selenocysteine methylase